MKTAKTYRLSARALENLEWIKKVSGANETALVKMAIAVLVGVLPGEKRDWRNPLTLNLTSPGAERHPQRQNRRRNLPAGHANGISANDQSLQGKTVLPARCRRLSSLPLLVQAAGKAGPDGLQEGAGVQKRDAPMLAVVLFAGCKGSRLRPPDEFALHLRREAAAERRQMQARVGRALGWFSPLLNLAHDLV